MQWQFGMVVVWHSGNVTGHINKVALHQAGLVLRSVTVLGYTILVFNQATEAISANPESLPDRKTAAMSRPYNLLIASLMPQSLWHQATLNQQRVTNAPHQFYYLHKYSHLGSRAFAVAGPKAWNQLPAHLRTLETVKTALKTYLHSIQWLSQIVCHAVPL